MKMNIRPLKRTSLSDDLVDRLMEMIRSEAYKPGDRLPSIMEMTRHLGVGHPTLREALRKLEAIGVVEIKHGSGVYVRRDQELLVVSNPVFGGKVSKKLMVDLLDARMPIEVKAAGLAAQHATQEQLDNMARLLNTAAENLDDDSVLNSTNIAFHCEIALASGNTVLAQLQEVLNDLFRNEQRVILGIYGDRSRDHEEHKLIFEAIKENNQVKAMDRMQSHLEGVREMLLSWDPKRTPVS